MEKHKCKLCGKEVSLRTFAVHMRYHERFDNITYLQYIEQNLDQFPNWRRCKVCGKITTNPTTCSEQCKSDLMKTQTGKNSRRYGIPCSEEAKKKISKKRLENQKLGKYEFLKGDTNPSCRPEVKKKIAKTRKERGCGLGESNGMYGKTHTPDAIKKIFSHRKMNKLEKLVADTLTKAGYEYYFQFFIQEGDVCKSYDFKIKGKPVIIEVDGDFWHGNSDIVPKNKQFKYVGQVQENDNLKEHMAHNNGYSIHRYWGSDIKKNPSIILQKI